MGVVAQLMAALGLDAKQYKAGMADVQRGTKSFQSMIGTVGKTIAAAFSVGAVISFGKSLITWSSNVSQAAANVGILTSEMIALNRLAIQNGLDVGDMQKVLSKLRAELWEAATNGGKAAEKFTSLGLSIDYLTGLDPVTLLKEVSKAAFDSGIPLQRLADIFGERLGPRIVTALKEISEGELPKVSEEAGKAADAVEEAADRMASAWDRVKQAIVAAIGSTKEQKKEALKTIVNDAVANEQGVNPVVLLIKHLFPQFDTPEEQAARTGTDTKPAAPAAPATVEVKPHPLWNTGAISEQEQLTAIARDTMAREENEKQKRDHEQRRKVEEERSREREALKQPMTSEIKSMMEDNERLKERLQTLPKEIHGESVKADVVAQMGGSIGGERPGLGIVDKQFRLQQESASLLKQIEENTRAIGELKAKIEIIDNEG
jgi:hypothetical protein